jgi:hypothetical protein
MKGSDHEITETADKIRIQTKIKRGTGTRDQDTHNLKARGRTPEEVARRMEVTIAELEERDVFDTVREIQSEGSDE